MTLRRTALKLGIQAIQAKLGESYGYPSFDIFDEPEAPQAHEQPALHAVPPPTKTRAALLRPPRIIETR